MKPPRLTIAIPTLDRPKMLRRALESCLKQTVPVQVVVCDQGETDGTAEVMGQILSQTTRPILWMVSGATTLWENWRFGGMACRTEFFAWLQDDDTIRPNYAARVIQAFDAFPDADCWMACNKLAVDERLAYACAGNHPWVPMNYQEGIPDQWEGQILVPTSYFTSWSLSPAVAFRRGPAFSRALEMMPRSFDIFQERAILAATCFDGHFIADPAIAGMWIHHDGNESYRQHADQPRQTGILVDWLDDLMDRTEGWQEILEAWCRLMHPGWLTNWVGQLDVTQQEGHPGRYTNEVRSIMVASLKGRVEVKPMSEAEIEACQRA